MNKLHKRSNLIVFKCVKVELNHTEIIQLSRPSVFKSQKPDKEGTPFDRQGSTSDKEGNSSDRVGTRSSEKGIDLTKKGLYLTDKGAHLT